jgi:hypothetical protein
MGRKTIFALAEVSEIPDYILRVLMCSLLYPNGGELLLLMCRVGFRIIQMETLSNLNWPIRDVIPAQVGIQWISAFAFMRVEDICR